MGRIAGVHQVGAVVGSQGPVVVLTGAIYPIERLFVEKAGHAVASGYLFNVSITS